MCFHPGYYPDGDPIYTLLNYKIRGCKRYGPDVNSIVVDSDTEYNVLTDNKISSSILAMTGYSSVYNKM